MLRRIISDNGIKLFDVTMRDGLQSIKRHIPLETKKNMTVELLNRRRPDSIEIGALVSPKAMPQMSTSVDLFNYTTEYISKTEDLDTNVFVLVPPKFEKMCQAHELGVRHVSIMSSVSDEFQLKNVRQTTEQTLSTITNSLQLLHFDSAKVYLSCVDRCPVTERRFYPYQIADAVADYSILPQVSEICLSDTMGTLHWNALTDILDEIKASDISMDKISLHLHVNENDHSNVTSLLYIASKAGVKKLDVSDTSTGGCNMTLDASQLHGNLTYDVLRSSIEKYTIMRDIVI